MDKIDKTDFAGLDSFEQQLKQRIYEGFVEVPMLPNVANKALALAQDRDSSAVAMVNMIKSDQYLTGQVLKTANSPKYTPTANLVSLQQAIALLGMNRISEIVLGVVKGAKLFTYTHYVPYLEYKWKHALATSLWAEELARHLRRNVGVSFLAGHMHSIGRCATIVSVLDLAAEKQLEIPESVLHSLEAKYHHQVTEIIVKRWEMPARVIEAVSHLHSQDIHDRSAMARIASTVRYATHIANWMLKPEIYDQQKLFELDELAALNLYQYEIEKLFSKTDEIQQKLEKLS